jgi:hypothetical protein
VPGWLHDEHSIITLTSFQVNREVRLILTHQSHNATVGVQIFEPLHFCLLLETVTKNKPILAAISLFLTGSNRIKNPGE